MMLRETEHSAWGDRTRLAKPKFCDAAIMIAASSNSNHLTDVPDQASRTRYRGKLFLGTQVRYLTQSDHGCLGAIGFCQGAQRLAARERFMNWSDAERRAHLQRVLCLNRFSSRVRCTNLAIKVLGLVLRQLPIDFEARYGFLP